MTLQEMILALEDGPTSYELDEDYVYVPVATANEIARLLRAVEEQNKMKSELKRGLF